MSKSKIKPNRQEKVSREVAEMIVPEDLPDGAYFAMMEELTGQDIAALYEDEAP